jgi:hypothetical protein
MALLAVPGTGFVATSVNRHRSDLIIVADWVEGTALFFNRTVSRMEIRDFLCASDYYQDQTFAMEFVELIWGELRRRNQWLQRFAMLDIDKDTVEPLFKWQDAAGHAFCLMLTCLQRYSKKQHPKLHNDNYVKQGDLFERFSEESLVKLGWKTLRTGWASGIANPRFRDIINKVALELNESWINDDAQPVFKDAKDEGLDLLVHKPFSDTRVGRPFFLVQCASGGDWKEKLHTPRIEVWNKLVIFTTDPRRGFCFPLALSDDDFKATCARCTGMLLDRYRLLSSGTGVTNELSRDLQARLKQWIAPRVAALPTA